MAKKTSCKGFTLIELAVAIMVSSMLLTGLIPIYHAYINSQIITTTNGNMTSIVTALANYKALNGVLPCPASPTAAPGSAGYGVSDSQTCTAGKCKQACNTDAPNGTARAMNPNLAAGPASQVRIGAVPFATLGIGETTTLDGWGNQYEYAVSEQLADSTIAFNYNNGAITLYSGDGATQTTEGPIPNHTPFMLVSLGPTGHGAYTPAGVLHAACASSGSSGSSNDGDGPQETNCSNTGVFRNMPYSSSTNNQNRFDNITSASLNQEIGGGGCPVVSLKCRWGSWNGLNSTSAANQANNAGSYCTPPSCPAGWADLGIPTGSTGVNAGMTPGAADDEGGIAGYSERFCQASVPYTIIYLRCRWGAWNGSNSTTAANQANNAWSYCTPPVCPAGWTDLGVTGMAASAATDNAGVAGYAERICYQ